MTTATKLTLDQFLTMPETKPGNEYVAGEVVQKTMPTRAHGITQALVAAEFNRHAMQHDLGEVGTEVRCIFGPPGNEQARLPDVSFIAAARLPDSDDVNVPFYGPPDVAVEVVSPDDRPGAVMDKIFFYLDNGVRLVLLMDPDDRTIRLFTPAGTHRLLRPGDVLDGGDVLPGLSVAVEALFPRRQ